MTIDKYTPVSVKDRAKIFESSNEYGYVKDSKDAVPSTTNGLENKSVEIKANTDILLQHSSETEEEKFMSVKQRAQAWENNKTTTDKKDESNKNVVKNLSSSVSEISTDESDSEESGLELGLETASNTSSRSEINHDGANHVEENVDNQTLENALRSQKEENLSLKQKIQDLESENATLKGGLGKTKTKTNEVQLEKAQKELTELKSYITGHGARLDTLEKLNEENESLKQKIQDLESENATLKGGLGKTKTKTNEVQLEKAQKELTELKSYITGHGARLDTLEKLNEENESLKQKIQDLESENATLKGGLGKTKTKTNEVQLEKAQKELTELKSYITGHGARLDTPEKLNEENESLEQKIQELGNKNTKLKDKLDKTETKAEALLEKTQKELAESKSCIAEHETKLKEFNKENESLKQKIKNLKNENTTLKGTTKTKTDEVSLEKVEKRQFSPKVACASLAAMLAVGAALSIASGLSALLIVAASVVSALIAGGITYTISKPIAPDTELKGFCRIYKLW